MCAIGRPAVPDPDQDGRDRHRKDSLVSAGEADSVLIAALSVT